MSDFIYFMRGGDARTRNLSETEMSAHMQEWKEYMGRLGAAGKLQGGAPLGMEGLMISGENKAESEGLLGGDTQVNGYILLTASDMSEAKDLAKDCPIFTFGGSLEIRECLDMSD